MNDPIQLMKLLYSCWIVSATHNNGVLTIPTSGGIMGHALHDMVTQGAFPNWFRENLHFVSGDAGLTCLELPLIESLAMEVKFTRDSDLSYTKSTIVVGKLLARRCLANLKIPETTAIEWGNKLREAVLNIENQFRYTSSVHA